MRHRLVERRISEDKLCIAENWADGREIFPIARNREGPLVIMYSGNLGLSHDIDTLLFAMKCLSGDPRFHFRFVGGGQRQRMVQAFCEEHNLQNVEFLPYCTRSKLAESLSQADIGLVTQRAESAGSVVPSKLYGLMAAGRPILYIGPRKTTPFWIIERFQCGWHADCGDGPRLVTLLEELHARPDLVQSAGVRARNAFLREYDLPQGVSRICNLFGAAVRPEVVAREPAAQTTLEGT
jgi:glycosyltransferase involved in cell wall biosynthesis